MERPLRRVYGLQRHDAARRSRTLVFSSISRSRATSVTARHAVHALCLVCHRLSLPRPITATMSTATMAAAALAFMSLPSPLPVGAGPCRAPLPVARAPLPVMMAGTRAAVWRKPVVRRDSRPSAGTRGTPRTKVVWVAPPDDDPLSDWCVHARWRTHHLVIPTALHATASVPLSTTGQPRSA